MSVHSMDMEYRHSIRIVSSSLEVMGKYPVTVAYSDALSFWILATGSEGIDLKCMINFLLLVMMWVALLPLWSIFQRWRPIRSVCYCIMVQCFFFVLHRP